MHTTNGKLKLIFDGKEYIVEVRETGSGMLEVEVNGKIHQVSLENLPPTQIETPKSKVSTAAAPSTQPQSAPTQPSAVHTNLVTAPMPGDIIKVSVEVGDSVTVGQELVILEAMKMKNVIRSPQEGKVSSVEVTAGQSVKYGQPMIRFG